MCTNFIMQTRITTDMAPVREEEWIGVGGMEGREAHLRGSAIKKHMWDCAASMCAECATVRLLAHTYTHSFS